MSAWRKGYKPMFRHSIVMVPHSQMLTSLRLHNFRCFEGVSVDIGPGLNLFFGGNGEGKTTILEGACVLLRLQSQRSASLAPVIQIGKKSFGVRGRFDEHELEFRYRALRRQVRFDGIEQRTLGEYLHLGRVVSLANVDIELVRGGSDARRRYLDFLGLQIDNAYRPALRAYERALRARNALLKSPTARPREIAAYDAPLIQHGQVLLRLRAELSELLVPLARGPRLSAHQHGPRKIHAPICTRCQRRFRRRSRTVASRIHSLAANDSWSSSRRSGVTRRQFPGGAVWFGRTAAQHRAGNENCAGRGAEEIGRQEGAITFDR